MLRKLAISRWFVCSAVLVFLFVRPAFAQAPSALVPTFTVSGTVVNARNGAPLSQTRVTLTDVRDRAGMSRFVITGEEGRFEFTSVPAGKYQLLGAHSGFRRSLYDQHEQFSTAIVTGPELDTKDLILRLAALAAISGKVTDESGEPVRNAQVVLYTRENFDGLNRMAPANRPFTDDQGTFEIRLLAAGTYLLSATATPWYAVHPVRSGAAGEPPAVVDPSLDVTYLPTYYNGATDPSAATPITLQPGDHPQVDLRLLPVPSLRVLVRMPVGDPDQPVWAPNLARAQSNVPEFSNNFSAQPISPGVFEISGVPPGRYSLVTHTSGGTVPHGEVDLRSNNQELDVADIASVAKVTIAFKVLGDANRPLQGFAILRDPSRSDSLPGPPSQEISSSGNVSLNVAPGRYSLEISSFFSPYVVSRTVSQGRESPGNLITVTSGASQDILAYLSPGIVSVEGFVKRKGKPVPGAMIVLVPKEPTAGSALFRRDQADFDGSFTLPNVLPGSYSILALENAWDLPWGQPGALTPYLSKSQSLTIGELMQRTVTLPEPLESQIR